MSCQARAALLRRQGCVAAAAACNPPPLTQLTPLLCRNCTIKWNRAPRAAKQRALSMLYANSTCSAVGVLVGLMPGAQGCRTRACCLQCAQAGRGSAESKDQVLYGWQPRRGSGHVPWWRQEAAGEARERSPLVWNQGLSGSSGGEGVLTLILSASLLGRVWSRARSNQVLTCRPWRGRKHLSSQRSFGHPTNSLGGVFWQAA